MRSGRYLPTRRALLAGTICAFIPDRRACAETQRIAVIDWAMLETILALGVVPIAGTELIQFRKIVVEPDVPKTVVDLGLRGSPNYELLRLLNPDLILTSNFYESKRPTFERIAPVLSRPVYEAGRAPYALAVETTQILGERLGRRDEAMRYIAETEAEIAELRQTLLRVSKYPVFTIILGDARHLQAFGADSMYGDVMNRLGVVNAWTSGTRYAAAAPIGLEALAIVPESAIAIIAPLPVDFEYTQASNAIWQALPAVRSHRVAMLPPINHFGGLPSARRFARLFSAAIGTMAASHE